ncbi:MAG: right-handed parallel beta-helix repeat-containing protein [Bacteroidota bacterium]
MNKWLGLLLPLIWTGLYSCEQPINPVSEGLLSFSADTVKYDSLFVNFQSPSERLLVYNRTGQDINIDRVWLESGEESEFEMIVDGIPGDDVEDVVIARGDSAHIFITLKSELLDEFTEEYISFQVGDNTQRLLLYAKVKDAYLLRARVNRGFFGTRDELEPSSFVFFRDTTLTPEKPIIIDGPIIIAPGVKVDVLPGTEIFFTPYKIRTDIDPAPLDTFAFYSTLIIQGTLRAEGTPQRPVVFQGMRFDSVFQELPAQWQGLYFTPSSQDNVLEHVVIKNGVQGVIVDSSARNGQPKLVMRNSRIRNMGAYGIVGLGKDPGLTSNFGADLIYMENSIINTCKLNTILLFGGGKYTFNNCTFANYSIFTSARGPQVRISNLLAGDSVLFAFPSYTRFNNCVIYGERDDEVVLDTLSDAPLDELTFDHCVLPLSEDYDLALRPHLVSSLVNVSPEFNGPYVRDYRPILGSPLIDAGKDIPGLFLDVRGLFEFSRTDTFDIGAYEYSVIEE